MLMLVWARRLLLILLCTVLGVTGTFSGAVFASTPLCTASISPTYVTPSSTNTFELEINNDGSTPIDYILVTAPSDNVTILDMTATGWGAQGGGSSMSLQYGSLDAGNSLVISVLAETGPTEASAANWTVDASSDMGGSSASCNGALDLTISSTPPSSIPPVISAINITNLSATSVTINWVTDEGATSQVAYGRSVTYDTTTTVITSLTSSHKVVLNDLEADTAYHYQVISTDAGGNTAYSSDNTFLTPVSASDAQSSTLNSRSTIKSKPTESVPPVLDFSVILEKAYKTAPTLKGAASDNEAVAVVEYSTDNGKNWLPATVAAGIGTKKVTFEINPQQLNDGNYLFIVRVVDTSGNATASPVQTLVIDKLPPVIGGVVVTQGNQAALPNDQGELLSQVGIDQAVVLSAVGGPTDIVLSAKEKTARKSAQTFGMVRSPQTGLWKGVVSFTEPGTYSLTAEAIDGAGNRTERALNTVKVIAPGVVKDAKGNVLEAEIKVYIRSPETKSWELWDAESYLQKNPKKTTTKEGVSYYLPEGRYYLKISSPGYQSVITSSFNVESPNYINPSFVMKRSLGVTAFRRNVRLPWFTYEKNVAQATAGRYAYTKGLTDHSLSQFSLPLTNGKVLKTSDLYGKPTVATFISTWSSLTSGQLSAFDELDSKTINLLPIGAGESMARLKTYTSFGQYKTPILVDTSNKIADELKLGVLPVTYFIDRRGVVKKTVVGVLSRDEILNNLTL